MEKFIEYSAKSGKQDYLLHYTTNTKCLPVDRIYIDTESMNFVAPTMLIQYQSLKMKDKPVVLHEIFNNTVRSTLELITSLMDNILVFYNASHDAFHLTKTFNILYNLPLDEIPNPDEYLEIERNIDTYKFLLKPKGCVDLLINTRKSFQTTMKTHPIKLKIPKLIAEDVKRLMEEKFLMLPKILYAKNPHGLSGKPYIRIIEICDDGFTPVTPQMRTKEDIKINKDWVYIRLDFNPSAKLKDVMKWIFNKEVKQFELNVPIPKCEQYLPHGSNWIKDFWSHKLMWQNNKIQRKYATDDVLYLMELDEYFNFPESNYEGELSFFFGSQYCIGYSIDLNEVQSQLQKNIENDKNLREELGCLHVNTNAPAKVKNYLYEGLDDMYKVLIPDTSKETFKILSEEEGLPEDLLKKVKGIIKLRKLDIERRLMNKLNNAKRLFTVFKVMGTRTNRESGGDTLTKGKDKINPQGIPKGELRKFFTFNELYRQGGDFNQFEVTIWLARYNDPKLNELIKSGKKIHGIWGSYIYNMSYEDIMKKENEHLYKKAKNSFFAMLYGAQIAKLAMVTGLTIEQVTEAFNKFYADFTKVKEAQEEVKNMFTILRNWKYRDIPKKYIESFLGFRRDFTTEILIMELLISIANGREVENISQGNRFIKKKRGSGFQEITLINATKSALFSEVHQMEAHIQRIAGNFVIQSPGGEMTKILQGRLNSINPSGIIHKDFYCTTFNVHDELICTGNHYAKSEKIVNDFISEYRKHVPFLSIDWHSIKNWSEK